MLLGIIIESKLNVKEHINNIQENHTISLMHEEEYKNSSIRKIQNL